MRFAYTSITTPWYRSSLVVSCSGFRRLTAWICRIREVVRVLVTKSWPIFFFFFGIPSFSLEIFFSSLKSIDSHAVEVWKESTRRPIGRPESPCYGIDWCSAQKCIKWNQTPWGSGFFVADGPSLGIDDKKRSRVENSLGSIPALRIAEKGRTK